MPQISIEHSCNISPARGWNELLGRIHEQLAGLAGIELDACKSRVQSFDTFRVGDGAPARGFVHLVLRIFAGRSSALKAELGMAALDLLRRHLFDTTTGMDVQLTVEIDDIDRDSYFRDHLHSRDR